MSRKGDRSSADREAARLERARKRAEREGRPFSEDEVALPPVPGDAGGADAGAPADGPPYAADDAPPSNSGAADPHVPFEPPAPLARPGAEDPVAFESAPVPDPLPPAAEAPPLSVDPAAPHDAPADEAPLPLDPAAPPAPADRDLQETQQWDAAVAWTDESAVAGAPDEAAQGPTTVHEPEPDAVPDPLDEPGPGETGTGPIVPAEVPLGTRRVRGRARMPQLHRPGGGGRKPRMRRPGELGPPRRRTTVGGRIAGGIVILLVIALGWFLISLFQPFGGGGDGSGRIVVRIPEGSSAGDIGTLLADRGVVDSGFFFNIRATVSGDRGKLKSGRFGLRRGMSYAAALEALTATEAVAEQAPTIELTIPEGRSRRETAATLRDTSIRGGYIPATRRSAQLNPRNYGAPADATLEGFLFPATYELRRGARVQRLVDDQLATFKRNFRTVDLRYARSKNLTAYDVLTIASMVEREVSVASERPQVAAVIYNRLNQGIPLGIDATLRFEQNDWTNPLRQSVLDADTPYNTRIRAGLPPGPIGSPGLASIRAAARPARVGYTYYVVDPCSRGEHAFANTYDEHLANVARYERAREAAGGNGLRC